MEEARFKLSAALRQTRKSEYLLVLPGRMRLHMKEWKVGRLPYSKRLLLSPVCLALLATGQGQVLASNRIQ